MDEKKRAEEKVGFRKTIALRLADISDFFSPSKMYKPLLVHRPFVYALVQMVKWCQSEHNKVPSIDRVLRHWMIAPDTLTNN